MHRIVQYISRRRTNVHILSVIKAFIRIMQQLKWMNSRYRYTDMYILPAQM